MAKYELTDEQRDMTVNLLAISQVRVMDASKVVQIINVLQKPIVEKPEEKK